VLTGFYYSLKNFIDKKVVQVYISNAVTLESYKMKKEVTVTKIRKETLDELRLLKSLIIVKGLERESNLDILERLIKDEVNRLKKLE